MDLGRVEELGKAVSLHYTIPTIHVTGTNGKGSVVSLISSMLMATGVSVGSYTSPYLVSPRDAVCVDGSLVGAAVYEDVVSHVQSQSRLLARRGQGTCKRHQNGICSCRDGEGGEAGEERECGTRYKHTGEEREFSTDDRACGIEETAGTDASDSEGSADRRPSSFEEETVAALLCFQRCCVDVAVVETGYGAPWDATMIVPDSCVLASVITSISLDHSSLLGATEEEIARTKSSITRLGKPLIVPRNLKPNVMKAILSTTRKLGATVIVAPSTQRLPRDGVKVLNTPVRLNLLGQYQESNLAVAAAVAIHVLGKLAELVPGRINLDIAHMLQNGVRHAICPGRLERIKWHIIQPRRKSTGDRFREPVQDIHRGDGARFDERFRDSDRFDDSSVRGSLVSGLRNCSTVDRPVPDRTRLDEKLETEYRYFEELLSPSRGGQCTASLVDDDDGWLRHWSFDQSFYVSQENIPGRRIFGDALECTKSPQSIKTMEEDDDWRSTVAEDLDLFEGTEPRRRCITEELCPLEGYSSPEVLRAVELDRGTDGETDRIAGGNAREYVSYRGRRDNCRRDTYRERGPEPKGMPFEEVLGGRVAWGSYTCPASTKHSSKRRSSSSGCSFSGIILDRKQPVTQTLSPYSRHQSFSPSGAIKESPSFATERTLSPGRTARTSAGTTSPSLRCSPSLQVAPSKDVPRCRHCGISKKDIEWDPSPGSSLRQSPVAEKATATAPTASAQGQRRQKSNVDEPCSKGSIWLDGAHNVAALQAIRPWIAEMDLVIVGFVENPDRDLDELIKCLAPAVRVAFVSFNEYEDQRREGSRSRMRCREGSHCREGTRSRDGSRGAGREGSRSRRGTRCRGRREIRCRSPLVCSRRYVHQFGDEGERRLFGSFPTLRKAIEEVEKHPGIREVLVTGSLYLVADFYKTILLS